MKPQSQTQVIEWSPSTIFEDLERMVRTTCTDKKYKGLIITGLPGTGKTFNVKRVLKSIYGKPENVVLKKGYCTPREFYNTLCEVKTHLKQKVLVYDDCDSILDDKVTVNIIKGALDPDHDPISWGASGATFNFERQIAPDGLANWALYDQLIAKGKVPSQVIYDKPIIIISNKYKSKIDTAILSRCFHIDVSLSPAHMMSHLTKIIKYMSTAVDMKLRQDVLEYMNEAECGVDLNIRTLDKAIAIASGNPLNWKEIVDKYIR